MAREKETLFSVKAGRDFTLTPDRGSGPGGQHRNKKYTAIRLEHPASGVTLKVSDSKSQETNKKNAIKRLAEHPKFRAWVRYQVALIDQGYRNLEAKVDDMLDPANLRIEYGSSFKK